MTDVHPHSQPHPDLAGYLLGTLEPEETRTFADHLAGCGSCRSELEMLGGIPGLLADVPEAQPLPAGLEERTFADTEEPPAQPGAATPTAAVARAAPAAGAPTLTDGPVPGPE